MLNLLLEKINACSSVAELLKCNCIISFKILATIPVSSFNSRIAVSMGSSPKGPPPSGISSYRHLMDIAIDQLTK